VILKDKVTYILEISRWTSIILAMEQPQYISGEKEEINIEVDLLMEFKMGLEH
jgi:hypothetical protein